MNEIASEKMLPHLETSQIFKAYQKVKQIVFIGHTSAPDFL